MKLIKKNNKKGFTLIELVIVIAILAILALILVPAISKYIGDANVAKNQASARTIYTNAVLANSTGDNLSQDELNEKTEELSNAPEDTVFVNLDKDGEVESVTYTPEAGGASIYFDGKSFDKPADTPGT